MTGGAQDSGVVSRQDALDFLGDACRNWQHVGPLSPDDVSDVAGALQRFVKKRATPAPAGWQTINEAPEVKGKYFFCRLAWGPEWDRCTGDGFRWNGLWFVAAIFHNPGVGFDGCQYGFRQIEVQPTHFMTNPTAPAEGGV